jgi:hypothetical protein
MYHLEIQHLVQNQPELSIASKLSILVTVIKSLCIYLSICPRFDSQQRKEKRKEGREEGGKEGRNDGRWGKEGKGERGGREEDFYKKMCHIKFMKLPTMEMYSYCGAI